jgi:hypothetical protein
LATKSDKWEGVFRDFQNCAWFYMFDDLEPEDKKTLTEWVDSRWGKHLPDLPTKGNRKYSKVKRIPSDKGANADEGSDAEEEAAGDAGAKSEQKVSESSESESSSSESSESEVPDPKVPDELLPGAHIGQIVPAKADIPGAERRIGKLERDKIKWKAQQGVLCFDVLFFIFVCNITTIQIACLYVFIYMLNATTIHFNVKFKHHFPLY